MGIFPTQGSNLSFLHWQVDSLPLSHLGSLRESLPKANCFHSLLKTLASRPALPASELSCGQRPPCRFLPPPTPVLTKLPHPLHSCLSQEILHILFPLLEHTSFPGLHQPRSPFWPPSGDTFQGMTFLDSLIPPI